MKLKVIKDAFYVCEDLSNWGMVSKEELEASYSHQLVVGDIWETNNEYPESFDCIEGKQKGEISSWWSYKGLEDYFEIID